MTSVLDDLFLLLVMIAAMMLLFGVVGAIAYLLGWHDEESERD